MRELTKIINGKEYNFINESFSNYRNWGHKSKLYLDNILVGENKSIYLNRTWEEYPYQSCMKGIIYNLLDEKLQESFNKYREEHNKKRLAKEIKEELEVKLRESQKDLYELLNSL